MVTPMTSSLPPKDHQTEGIRRLRSEGRALLADEPGLGKTRTAIEASEGKTLVIAPGLILNSGTWSDEVALWADDPDRFWVAPYSRLNHRIPTKKGGTKPVKRLRDDIRLENWDTVILDEAHYVKNSDALWTWAVKQISKRAKRLYMLTGTPIPNWAHEMFVILQLLYPEDAKPGKKFGSFWRWAGEWFTVYPNPHNPDARVVGDLRHCYPECLDRQPNDPCEHYIRFTQTNFGNKFIRHKRTECLDLPPITRTEIRLRMGPEQRQVYNSLKNDFYAQYNGVEVLAWTQGSSNVLLDKTTTSPWLIAPKGEPGYGKLARLRSDLADRVGGNSTLVLAHYRDTVEACAAVARAVGHRAEFIHGGVLESRAGDIVRRFKNGETSVLVGSLETISEGLTLTVADTAIFVESSYKPSRNEQATYRIYRMGQDKPVTIIDYVTAGTVDAAKRKLLATKSDRALRHLSAADFRDLI